MAFVIIVSIFPITDSKPANDLIIENTNSLKEVRAFLSRYPSATVTVERSGNEIDVAAVKYSQEKK